MFFVLLFLTPFCGMFSHLKRFARWLCFLYKQSDLIVVSNSVTCIRNVVLVSSIIWHLLHVSLFTGLKEMRTYLAFVTCVTFYSLKEMRTYLAFVACVTFYRLERDAYPLFRMLRQKYKTSTDRDPVFQEVVLFL